VEARAERLREVQGRAELAELERCAHQERADRAEHERDLQLERAER
jgi:hypothetical protein